MRFFVFVDLDYYPYIGDPVEADTADEALRLAIENERAVPGMSVFVAPAEFVSGGAVHGPHPRPHSLIELMQKHNRFRSDLIEAKNLRGVFSVKVEPGTME